MRYEPVKIIADQIAPMHWALLSEATSQCVAHNIPARELDNAIRIDAPDVMILDVPEPHQSAEFLKDWMNGGDPSCRVTTLIFEEPSPIHLCEWQNVIKTLNEVSINELYAVIKGSW